MKTLLLVFALTISGCAQMTAALNESVYKMEQNEREKSTKRALAKMEACEKIKYKSAACSYSSSVPSSNYPNQEIIYQIMPSGNTRPVYIITK
jgi:hypothetical protein